MRGFFEGLPVEFDGELGIGVGVVVVDCAAQFHGDRLRVGGELADDVGSVYVISVDEAAQAEEDEDGCDWDGDWVGAEEVSGGSAGRERAAVGWPLRCPAKEGGSDEKGGFGGVKGTRCWRAKGRWIWK